MIRFTRGACWKNTLPWTNKDAYGPLKKKGGKTACRPTL